MLLAGGGDTAHAFDDFAPKLTRDFHVYVITRRGFGESSFAPVTAGADTFGDDVLAVLDALTLERPILAGHSIAGQELSSIGTRYPNRVAGLVYFDAGCLRQYYLRVLDFTYAEGELRQKRSTTPEGRVGPPRSFPGGRRLLTTVTKYVEIQVPALFLVSSQSPGRWAETSTDPKIKEQLAAMSALLDRQAKSIADALPNARVVKLTSANHYVFLSNEADVLREMRAFLARVG